MQGSFFVALCHAFISSKKPEYYLSDSSKNIPVKKLNEIYIVSLTSLASMRNEKKSNLQGIDAPNATLHAWSFLLQSNNWKYCHQ